MTLDRENVETAARKFVDSGKYASALNEYQKLVADRPRDARMLHKIADVHVRMMAYADAAATYERAGDVFELEGKFEKATFAFEQVRGVVLQHAPELRAKHARVWTKLASAHVASNRTREAVDVLIEICALLAKQKREAELEETWQRIVDLEPYEPSHHAALGDLLLRTGDPRGAATSLSEAADLYLARGDVIECHIALEKLEICHRQAPDNLDVLFLVAKSFEALGKREESLAVRAEMAQVAFDKGEMSRLEELLVALPAANSANSANSANDDDEFEVVSEDELFFEDDVAFAPESTDASQSLRDSFVRFTGDAQIETAIDTIDSLIDWGMIDEAREVLREHLGKAPMSTLLRERLVRLEQRAAVRTA